jgi:hypothetical protein
MRHGLALLLAVALAGCATAPPTPGGAPVATAVVDAGPPAPPADPRTLIEPLRAEARALLKTQTELYWKHWTTGEPIDLAATYANHDALFGAASVTRLQAAEAAEPDAGSRRALEHLELYLAGEHLAQAVAQIGESQAAIEGAATITVEGSELPFRQLEQSLAMEPSHPRRLAIAAAAAPVLARLAPLLEQRQTLLAQQLSALGYPGYEAYGARLREADLDALSTLAEQVLSQTDALYPKALAEAVHRELNLALTDVRRADLPRFFHASAVQSAFPAPQQLPRFIALLQGMGIDLQGLKAITIDARVLPRKSPRALCLAVSVPDDVRLSIKPQGGVDEAAQLFHEGAHAVALASTTTPTWELQQLGDAAVAESLARLFENLVSDPRYLAELGMTGELLDRDVRSAAVKQLYLLRRDAALFLLERAAHGTPMLQGDALRARARELLSRAEGVPLDDLDVSRELFHRGDFFDSADGLRARVLAGQLEQQLTTRFGDRWWHKPEAGTFLRGLWAEGTGLSATALEEHLGATLPDPAPLFTALQARLKSK